MRTTTTDVASLEPDNLAGTQSTTVAEREHHVIPEASGPTKQPFCLV